MVKDRSKKFVWLGLFMAMAIVWPTLKELYSQTISYLPRDESMSTVSKEYSPALNLMGFGKDDCTVANELFRQSEECYNCVQNLKPPCPDCCLVNAASGWVINCTPSADPQYNCPAQPFAFLNCRRSVCNQTDPNYWDTVCANPATLNHCQVYGCSNTTEPKCISTKEKCIPSAGGSWNCNFRRNALAKDAGCQAINGTCQSPCKMPYYDPPSLVKQPIIAPLFPLCPDGNYPCYKYTPRKTFLDCIDVCKRYASGWDSCNNGVECCKRNVCPTPSGQYNGGFNKNCALVFCQKRLAIPKCAVPASSKEAYTEQLCAKLSIDANNCLTKGKCSACFKEIDHNFSYKFVAKSREGITVVWQLITQPRTPAYFLYTKVKVLEISPTDGIETVVHDSMVHQKSLEAAFSIFCATHVPSSVLKPGHAYVARVYYFLPYNQSGSLQVDIQSMRLITIRTRE